MINFADSRRRRLERHEIRRKARRKAKRLNRHAKLVVRRNFAKSQNLIFDRNIDRKPLVLPKIFSLSSNYIETAEVISSIRECIFENNNSVMLHFENVEVVEPAASLALVSEIHRVHSLVGRSYISGTYPRSRSVYLSLCDMGFFSLLKIIEISDAPREESAEEYPIYLRFISDNRVYPEIIDRFVSILEKYIMAMNALARERLVAAIVEATSNALDHAYPQPQPRYAMPNRWWMSSWVSVAAKEVTIAFFDQGVGIPSTLDPTAYESIRAALANISQLRLSARPSDGEMILAATEYHRSGTGSKGRGRGFADMKRFVDVCTDGELRVLSYKGTYHYIKGVESFGNEPVALAGTLIEWRFRHDGTVEMIDG